MGEVRVNGRTHKGLNVYFRPLKQLAAGSLEKRADVKAALAKDPKAQVVRLSIDVETPGMKGGGIGGRVSYVAGPLDLTGVFQLADTPADAPAVHCGGPLQISFDVELPTLRIGRSSDLVLVVGTPGVGPGTFAMLQYEDTIPRDVWPRAELSFPPARGKDPPRKELFEIKERC